MRYVLAIVSFSCLFVGGCCLSPITGFPDKWRPVPADKEEFLEIKALSGRAGKAWKVNLSPAIEDPKSGTEFVDGSPYLVSQGRLVIQKKPDLLLLSETTGAEISRIGGVISSPSLAAWETEGEIHIITDSEHYVLIPQENDREQYRPEVNDDAGCQFAGGKWICVKIKSGLTGRYALVVMDGRKEKLIRKSTEAEGKIKVFAVRGKVLYLSNVLRTPDGFMNKKGFVNYEKLTLRAYDVESDRQLWETQIGPVQELHTEFWSGALKTPEGKSILTQCLPSRDAFYVVLGIVKFTPTGPIVQGETYAVDPTNGRILWQTRGTGWWRDEDAYSRLSTFLVLRNGEEDALYSLDPFTGHIRQRYHLKGVPSLLQNIEDHVFIGNTTILYIRKTQKGETLVVLDKKTGGHLWELDLPQHSGIPVFGDNAVIVGDPRGQVLSGGGARFFYGIHETPKSIAAYEERTGKPMWTARVIGGDRQRIVGVHVRGKRAFVRTASGALYAILWE